MNIKMNITNGSLALLDDIHIEQNIELLKNSAIKKERSNYVHKSNGAEFRKPSAVEPIRSKEDLKNFCQLFKDGKSSDIPIINARNYAIFILGISTGLRVSDLLKLKVRDVIKIDNKTQELVFQDRLHIVEQKTGKTNFIPKLSDKCKLVLNNYFSLLSQNGISLELKDYLWVTAGAGVKIKIKKDKPIDKANYYDVLRKMQNRMEWEIPINIGTHTMRKTFGYWMFKNSKDEDKTEILTILQDWYNHSTPKVTLRYIGITKEDKLKAFQKFDDFLNDFIENDF